MAKYVRGTSAYKYEEYNQPVRKTSAKRKQKVDVLSVIGYIIVAVLAFAVLGRSAAITAKNAEVEELEKTYIELTEEAIKTDYELEKNIDLKTVEEIATTKLGMQRPEKHQLVYISMDNTDYCEVEETEKSGGVLAFISKHFSGILK